MDMTAALVAHLKRQLATGMLPAEEAAKLVEEIHYCQRRIVRPRDTSKDNEPITVGIMR